MWDTSVTGSGFTHLTAGLRHIMLSTAMICCNEKVQRKTSKGKKLVGSRPEGPSTSAGRHPGYPELPAASTCDGAWEPVYCTGSSETQGLGPCWELVPRYPLPMWPRSRLPGRRQVSANTLHSLCNLDKIGQACWEHPGNEAALSHSLLREPFFAEVHPAKALPSPQEIPPADFPPRMVCQSSGSIFIPTVYS